MSNDNKRKSNKDNQDISTNVFYDVLFMIIIPLLFANIYFTYKNYERITQDIHPANVGSLQHYDSIYSKRLAHISMNENGEITGYHTPDGLYYIFRDPIPAYLFYND